MLKRMRNIKPRILLSHLLITLAYPCARSLTAGEKRLLIFTDALTVTAAVMLIGGVFYSLYLSGHYDITGFVFKRARRGEEQTFDAYMADRNEKKADAFNYPLFLALVYLAVSAVLAYGFL